MTNIVVNSNRYEALLKAEKELNALRAGGVDNWEGYDACFEDEEDEEDGDD